MNDKGDGLLSNRSVKVPSEEMKDVRARRTLIRGGTVNSGIPCDVIMDKYSYVGRSEPSV